MKIPQDSFTFEIVLEKGEKRAKINASNYYRHFINTKTKVGDNGTMHFTVKKPTRSGAQLRYYGVIVGLIAEFTGYTWEEVHDWMMVLKWGTMEVTIADTTVHSRLSVSDVAKFPKWKMVEQIAFAEETAHELNIKIPSREEMGYIEN